MKNKIVKITAVTLTAVFLFGCDKIIKKNPTEETDKKAETVYAVQTYKTQSGSLDDYLEFGGDVTPVSTVDIYPDTSGKLSELRIKVGDYVKKDAVIAQVDPSRPGATYSLSPVKAPVSGTVTLLPLQEGSTVAPALSLGKISSTGQLEISLSVPERYVSRIKLKQIAYLTFDAYAGERFMARVSKISPVLDTSTRGMTVTMELTPPDSRIKIGMYARIKLITENRENVLIVPYGAIVRRADLNHVFVKNTDNRVTRHQVTLGIRVDDRQEIVSGLKLGDEVVIKGQTLLDDGVKVNVINPDQAEGGK